VALKTTNTHPVEELEKETFQIKKVLPTNQRDNEQLNDEK